MLTRLLTALVLASIGLPATIYGGVFFWLMMALFLTYASWEYVSLMRGANWQPSAAITVSGVLALLIARTHYPPYESAVLTAVVFIAMIYHLITFEHGRDQAATDFAVTVAGLIYMGWIGSYLVKLRTLPDGVWWFFLVLPATWFADTGAYFIGKNFGKHKLSPRLSPTKTWEGYWGGVLFGTLAGMLFTWLWREHLGVTLLDGTLISFIMAALTTFGDLGESMIKRQAHIKDSSHIFPGHGGVFDRIDTWLWASALGYYLITWFFL